MINCCWRLLQRTLGFEGISWFSDSWQKKSRPTVAAREDTVKWCKEPSICTDNLGHNYYQLYYQSKFMFEANSRQMWCDLSPNALVSRNYSIFRLFLGRTSTKNASCAPYLEKCRIPPSPNAHTCSLTNRDGLICSVWKSDGWSGCEFNV